ncbi:glycosyl transferase family 90 [Vreelandella boliviensis]|uniref:Lipopolysaccharide A protein n=1 Tax=Vreelandella boliviensis LC1 TaxID=1072583 RepID=A0A265DYI0_9GAMM|nr:glycosyl transferase family 90 [Halomonas boliviensis]EHJ94238.1 Protein lpsA [Halomonas boliviensis LC1]OZT74393.1 lipopolysaccharide A protein [Halomonas boliviensis LC1]
MIDTQRLQKNMRKAKPYFTLINVLLKPKKFSRFEMRKLYTKHYLTATTSQKEDIDKRVAYYNKSSIKNDSNYIPQYKVGSFKKDHAWSYYVDMKELLSYFDDNLLFDYLPGDIQIVPKNPAFVKSRPIVENNDNSILLKLNKIRHYNFIQDNKNYDAKKDLLVWRGACHQPHRQYFIELYHGHQLCDVGDVRDNMIGSPLHKPFMNIKEQLDYKFILSIEGNDVATNLKWIMSSNSICFMTKPKFETWFMEGALVPGKHYVELNEDYSDLQEKIIYYLANPDEAKRIIKNANKYVKKFKDSGREKLISFLVMQKYFISFSDLDFKLITKSAFSSEKL